MAIIEWEPQAWQLYNDLLENGRLEFGEKTARNWEDEIFHIYDRLSRRFKLIYYYDEAEDVVHVIDIWDTKMNPQALIHRIK